MKYVTCLITVVATGEASRGDSRAVLGTLAGKVAVKESPQQMREQAVQRPDYWR